MAYILNIIEKIKHRNRHHAHSEAYKWLLLFNIMIGTFMAVLDTTIVNVCLPKIMASFGVGLDKIEWVITGFMLSMAVMLPTSAWLADRFGYKKMYIFGIILFTFGSMLCGMSSNENFLIFSRVAQGLGAGMIQPVGMAIITREFPPEQRGVALGFWAIAAAASVSFGPLIGGYLVDNFNWQLIFYVNVPVGIFGLLFTILIQKEYKNHLVGKLDVIGFISVAIFLPVLLYALSEGNAETNAEGWSAPYILCCFAVSIIALTVFITRELTVSNPLVDIRLMTERNFGLSNIIMVIFGMGMFGSTFLFPLYLQNALDYTALQAGSVFLPIGLLQGVISPIAGKLSDHFNPKFFIVLGMSTLATSFFLNFKLSLFSEHNSIMISLYLRGLGMGMLFSPLSALSLLNISPSQMGQASSITNIIRQFAGSLGVAIFTTLFTERVSYHNQLYGAMLDVNSPAYQQVIHNLAIFAKYGIGEDWSTATLQAKFMLASHIQKEAYVQGICDDFGVATLVTILAIIPVLMMQTKRKKQSKPL